MRKKNLFAHKILVANNLFAHNMREMNAIRFIRKTVFKVTQSEFAELAGVAQPSVSRWENGVAPSLDEMQAIRRAAADRGIAWDDSWFFETPEVAA
jgi:transcriptional regulator with XRE-family HTH domain